MANVFEITDDIRALARGAIDDLINQLGKTCKLIYESTETPCNNCYFDTTTGLSSGRYNGTGPESFVKGKCPVCGGDGFLPSATVPHYDTVTLLTNLHDKSYASFPPVVQVPDGNGTVKGYMADFEKFVRCKYIIVDSDHPTAVSGRYVKLGEPLPTGNIVKNRYFVATLKRFGS